MPRKASTRKRETNPPLLRTLEPLPDIADTLDHPYLTDAPFHLVTLHRRLHYSLSHDAPLLLRLLVDERMEPAWRIIKQRLKQQLKQKRHTRTEMQGRRDPFLAGWNRASPEAECDTAYPNIWQAVVSAVRASRAAPPKPRRLIRRQLREFASHVRALNDATTSGPLNLLAYELFPKDLRSAFQNAACGCNQCQLLPYVSLTEILEELAQRAEHEANEAFAQKRLVDRNRTTKNNPNATSTRAFIRSLARSFRTILGGPMPATLACFTAVVFDTDFSEDAVRQVLRRFRI
jgi:hypothetical protein